MRDALSSSSARRAEVEAGNTVLRGQVAELQGQGLTLVHFSAQPKPCWSHLSFSPCLIDWGEIPTYPAKCAYVETNSGRV